MGTLTVRQSFVGFGSVGIADSVDAQNVSLAFPFSPVTRALTRWMNRSPTEAAPNSQKLPSGETISPTPGSRHDTCTLTEMWASFSKRMSSESVTGSGPRSCTTPRKTTLSPVEVDATLAVARVTATSVIGLPADAGGEAVGPTMTMIPPTNASTLFTIRPPISGREYFRGTLVGPGSP